MPDVDARPDPDRLLRKLSAEQAKARAKLKIFFGFAPGVGKTYAMLEAARAAAARGVDVVVAAVETHGRSDTARMAAGLEVLPRKKHRYRGLDLEELDLDAALARRPAILLVDELAHTNVPGSRHTKRWQDVLELLDAGIEVHTTLNVQHVESLNDVIAQITHVQVRETVPDAILDRADEIELVDVSPEELLSRLAAGKVYLGEQAARATSHFFQRGNLLALRELALRRTAERVDADVVAYRNDYGVEATWPAGERVLVMVGPAPASARLVRAARRIAAAQRAPWIAAWVDSSIAPLGEDARARLESHLKLAETLGGSVVRLTGTKVSATVLDYARKHNVTRIVLGKPTHPRLRDLVRGSLLDEVVRGSGDIEIHVISGIDEPASAREATSGPRTRTPRADAAAYAMAATVIVVATGVAFAVDLAVAVPDVEMLFLLAVMISSRFGRGPSVLAAALSVLSYDFFFVAPRFTFAVADGRYLLTFAMLFGVGVVLSTLTLRLRQQERAARGREEEARAHFALSRDLGGTRDAPEIAEHGLRHVAGALECGVALLLPGSDGALELVAARPAGFTLGNSESSVASWAFANRKPAGLGTDTLPGAHVLCVPLVASERAVGVLALAPREPLGSEEKALTLAMAGQIAVALERAALASEAHQAAVVAKTEELRSALLSSVSHDLRTPLAAITGAATTLRDDAALGAEARGELLGSICEEAERLERLLANLLDMTRLDAGSVRLRREWLPIEEPIGSALTRLERKLVGREVKALVEEAAPLVQVDPLLVEQLLFNLLDNALKYTPEGSPIEVRACSRPGELELQVLDRGPGLPAAELERVFERFYRGRSDGGGAGLGLAICRAIATVHGGTIEAANREGGGAVFTVRIPQHEAAPEPEAQPAPAAPAAERA